MTPLLAKAICEPLYNFGQMAFANDSDAIQSTPFSHLIAEQFFSNQRPAKAITIKDAIQLPLDQKRVLRELLLQYVMFLSINEELPFPPEFLVGTNDLRLGVPLLEYLVHHRFPFPQLLPR